MSVDRPDSLNDLLLPTIPAVRARLDHLSNQLHSLVSDSRHQWLEQAAVVWHQRLLALQEETCREPDVTVALVGGTGAGKSTLVNAIVGARLLPVSTMKACTAAITEVAYTSAADYTADIEFLSRAEWNTELDALLADIADARALSSGNEAEDLSIDHEQSPAHISRAAMDKVRAVYDIGPEIDIQTFDFSHAVEPGEIARALKKGRDTIMFADLEEFRKKIDLYLNARHSFWPIVKRVCIRGPFEALQSGVRLVDLPGINDPNEAREAVTTTYLKTCRFVWIVFNMKRGLTKDVVHLLQSDDFMRQIVMDGRENALIFVGTHSDEIDTDAGRDEYNIDQEADDIEVIKARNEMVRQTVSSQLDETSQRLVRLSSVTSLRVRELTESFCHAPIFTVSAREYLRLRGVSRSKSMGIEDLDQTEMPQLLQHLQHVGTTYGAEAHARAVHRRLDLLLEEINGDLMGQRLRLMGLRRDQDAIRKEVTDAVATARPFLDDGLRRDQDNFADDMTTAEEQLRESLKRGVEGAQRDLSNVTERWQMMHWCTLRAVVRRNGVFVGSSGLRHDFVADLSRPMFTAITWAWADFFSGKIDTSLKHTSQQLRRSAEAYSQRLVEITGRLHGDYDTAQRDVQAMQVSTAKVLDERLSRTITEMRKRIEQDQRTLYEQIPTQVRSNMAAAFHRAAQESGTGMKTRMISILESHLRDVSEVMFDDAEQKIMEGVRALIAWLRERFDEMAQDVTKRASMMEDNLTRSDGEDASIQLRYITDLITIISTVPQSQMEEREIAP